MSVHNPTNQGGNTQQEDARPGFDAAVREASVDLWVKICNSDGTTSLSAKTSDGIAAEVVTAVYPVIAQALAADPDALLLLTGYQRSQKTGWKRATWKPEVEPVRGYPGADVEYVRDIFAGPWRLVGDKGEQTDG